MFQGHLSAVSRRAIAVLLWMLVPLVPVIPDTLPQLHSFGEDQTGRSAPIRIAILPARNLTGDQSLESLGYTIQQTLDVSLGLLGRFHSTITTLEHLGDLSPAAGSALPDNAEQILNRLESDNLIEIDIQREQPSGNIILSARVYAGAERRITVEAMERADTLFEVFDAADVLTDEVLAGLAGRRIEYGSLALLHSGEPVTVVLNDQPIGSGRTRFPAVVTGRYDLEIRQQRLLGEEVIHREVVTIERDVESSAVFSVPLLTDSEQQQFAERDSTIRSLVRSGEYPAAIDLISQAVTELTAPESAQVSSGYELLAGRYLEWRDLLADQTLPTEPAFLQSDWWQVALFRELEQSYPPTGSAHAHLPLTSFRFVERHHFIPYREIQIDGDFTDWAGIQPVMTGADHSTTWQYRTDGSSAMTIESISLARDDRFLYVRVVLANGEVPTPSSVTGQWFPSYKLHFHLSGFYFGLQYEALQNTAATQMFTWNHDSRQFRELARGRTQVSGNQFESAFPLAAAERYLQPGRRYVVEAVTMSIDTQQQWWNNRTHHTLSTGIVY